MQTITALAIDSWEGLLLLESAIKDNCVSMKIFPLSNLSDACAYLHNNRELPKAMIVSTSVLLREGEEKLQKIIKNDRFSSMNLFILTEFEGEEVHLCKDIEATYIAMPIGYDQMAGVVRRIYERTLAQADLQKKKTRQIV